MRAASRSRLSRSGPCGCRLSSRSASAARTNAASRSWSCWDGTRSRYRLRTGNAVGANAASCWMWSASRVRVVEAAWIMRAVVARRIPPSVWRLGGWFNRRRVASHSPRVLPFASLPPGFAHTRSIEAHAPNLARGLPLRRARPVPVALLRQCRGPDARGWCRRFHPRVHAGPQRPAPAAAGPRSTRADRRVARSAGVRLRPSSVRRSRDRPCRGRRRSLRRRGRRRRERRRTRRAGGRRRRSGRQRRARHRTVLRGARRRAGDRSSLHASRRRRRRRAGAS